MLQPDQIDWVQYPCFLKCRALWQTNNAFRHEDHREQCSVCHITRFVPFWLISCRTSEIHLFTQVSPSLWVLKHATRQASIKDTVNPVLQGLHMLLSVLQLYTNDSLASIIFSKILRWTAASEKSECRDYALIWVGGVGNGLCVATLQLLKIW